MPTIKFPKNPNVDTAFVEQDDGTKNRALMIAPQDISTLELPNNPNSTKGYITVDGKKQRVILTADITGGGGGGAVSSVNGQTGTVVLNAEDVGAVPQYSSMPQPNQEGDIVQYIGTTDQNYTNGYFYQSAVTGEEIEDGECDVDIETFQGGNDEEDLPPPTFDLDFSVLESYLASRSKPQITSPIVDIMVEYNQYNNFVVWLEYNKDEDAGTHESVEVVTSGDTISDVVSGLATLGFTVDLTGFTWLSYADLTLPTEDVVGWVQKDVQPAPVMPDPLPDQTGHSGDYLTTNGTAASWAAISALQNMATGTSSLSVGKATTANNVVTVVNSDAASVTTAQGSAVVGSGAVSQARDGVALGRLASVYSTNGEFGIAIGGNSSTRGRSGINIGYGSGSNGGNGDYVIAIGREANAKQNYSIQLGRGDNNEAGTFYVASYYNSANVNYKLMDADGTIPTARLTKVNSTITLTAAGWGGGSQSVTVTGMTATGVVLVSPDPTDQAAYTSAGILCTAQAADSLTFTCSTTPTGDIDVVVVML